ncbi:MAG: hypothetical protein NWQ31_02635 [Polaribacter sp.]|nr:hypothetical protein [Polaribacter sp.]
MKRTLKFIPFLLIILLQNCSLNDCNQACFTPPNSFQFEFIDATTKENLFTNKTFDEGDIKVINLADNTNIEFTFIDENDFNILGIGSIGWKTEIVECSIKVADKEILTLYVNAKRVSENCCSFTRFEEIRIENASYTLDNQKGIYTILVE